MTTFNRDEFRVQLLLQLPELGLLVQPALEPAGVPSDVAPGIDLFDSVKPDPDYHREFLAAWILEQLDSAVDLESDQAETVQLAAASGVVSSSVEFGRYLAQVAAVLKEGHGLAAQWDLARTISVEADRLLAVAGQLLARFPQLANVAGAPAENESDEGLALPRQTP